MKALIDEEENFDLPLTSMIDIVFLLLVFFLLATTIRQDEEDLQVNLPTGQQGSRSGTAAGTKLSISVRVDGTYTLAGKPISKEDLRTSLTDAGREKNKPMVHLRADEMAAYGKVAEVLQMCQSAKLDKVHCDFRFAPPK